jgi:hypothetical protein
MTWHFLLPQEWDVAMEAKRTDFDHIRQHVNKVKKYASDLQTFIGVNEMTSVVEGEAKKFVLLKPSLQLFVFQFYLNDR